MQRQIHLQSYSSAFNVSESHVPHARVRVICSADEVSDFITQCLALGQVLHY